MSAPWALDISHIISIHMVNQLDPTESKYRHLGHIDLSVVQSGIKLAFKLKNFLPYNFQFLSGIRENQKF